MIGAVVRCLNGELLQRVGIGHGRHGVEEPVNIDGAVQRVGVLRGAQAVDGEPRIILLRVFGAGRGDHCPRRQCC
jgi:ABC-type proline/glycine betaine transport system ATPase subunit